MTPAVSGQIELGGQDLTAAPIATGQALAFVPHEPRRLGQRAVREHLTLQSRRCEIADSAEPRLALPAEFQLEDRSDAFPAEPPRRMTQELMVKLALPHRPSVNG